jgi:hypothetical protein
MGPMTESTEIEERPYCLLSSLKLGRSPCGKQDGAQGRT